MRVALIGGNGPLGSAMRALAPGSVQWRVASRRVPQGQSDAEHVHADIGTGEGLDAALTGVDAVVHLASDPRRPKVVDVEGTRRLVQAAVRSGVRHLLYVSIVGIDRIPFPYYKAKLAAERIVEESGIPWTVQRATQFHWFIDALLGLASRFPVVAPLPTKFLVQSVAEREVAARLVQAIQSYPGGRLPDFGGPEVMSIGQALRVRQNVRGERKRVLHLPIPGRVAAGFRAGHNTTSDGTRGSLTWREWLEQQQAETRA